MAESEPSVATDAESRVLLLAQNERLRAEKDRSDVAREQVERHLHQMKEDMAHLRDEIARLRAALVGERAIRLYLEGWGDVEEWHGLSERQKEQWREKARAALGSSDSHPRECHCGRCAEKPAGQYPEPGGREPGKAAPQSPDVQTKYEELLLAVGNKHPGESRHETALRYIREAEADEGRG